MAQLARVYVVSDAVLAQAATLASEGKTAAAWHALEPALVTLAADAADATLLTTALVYLSDRAVDLNAVFSRPEFGALIAEMNLVAAADAMHCRGTLHKFEELSLDSQSLGAYFAERNGPGAPGSGAAMASAIATLKRCIAGAAESGGNFLLFVV